MELQVNAFTRVMTLRMTSSHIPIVGLGLHPENVNMRHNHNTFKKDMVPEGSIIVGFHPVSQKQIHSRPRLLTNTIMPTTTIVATQPPLWVD
jgi:hypothetical protein